jgi:serine/threonine protein phosphatase PrpC
MFTSIGSRDVNEDSAICLVAGGSFCFVVADGLGGHGKGEIASRLAVEAFRRQFEISSDEAPRAFLEKAFNRAQETILAEQARTNSRHGMKTTAVALAAANGVYAWGHIGDSRLYLFRKNKLKMRTLDHSVPQMLALSGEIKDKQISGHPDRNRLLRAIGIEWEANRYELSDEWPLSRNHAFLLCTDGFWEHIEEKKIRAYLKKSPVAGKWLEQMIEEVKKNGQGRDMDNNTAISVIW